MNIYPYTHHLHQFASSDRLTSVSSESALELISTTLDAPPTTESWSALLELFAAWPDAGDIGRWVGILEPERDHWPWRMRESYLGQAHTQAEKGAVYLLVGYLHIARIEDLFGEKLARWGADPNWRNLRGLRLSRMEADATAINRLLKGTSLRDVEEFRVTATDCLNGEMQALFGGVELANLETLGLTSLDLGLSDVLDLAVQPVSRTVRTLDISANHITGANLTPLLGDGQFPNLSSLDISYGRVEADELEQSLRGLNHPALSEIAIAHTPASAQFGTPVIRLNN